LRAALAFALLWAGVAPQVHHDIVRADVQFQVIENFGASDAWRMQKLGAWSIQNRERVADLLFSQEKGIGLSCWRFNIGGGVNPRITMPWRTVETFEIAEGQYDWSRQANERWFLHAAKKRGVPQFLAFVVSPPGRMTRNGLTFADPGPQTSNLKPGYEKQFARYMADILQHFRDVEGIDFDYISPVNEPQWDWEGHTQEGSRWSNEDVKTVLRALCPELKQRELRTQIAIVESGNIPDMSALNDSMTRKYGTAFGNYLGEFAGMREMLSGRIGYHSYWSDRLDSPLIQHRTALARKMQQYAGWKLWQTEYCVMDGPNGEGGNGRDLTMTTALNVARVIHYDLTIAGVSAWQWWTAVSEADYKDGLIYTDWRKPGDPETIYPSRLLWTLGNYSRFVRPGMRRIELADENHDMRGVLGSAFVDEKARRIVAVYLNEAVEPHRVDLRFDVGARPWRPRPLSLFVTSDRPGDELRHYPTIAVGNPIQLPARSVTTIVAEFDTGRE
jgi:O-glycosyl hydrolase